LGLGNWIRAGKGKTYWTKPHPVPRGLWALNAAGSSGDAPSEHSGRRIEGLDRGSRAFSPASQAGSDCFDHGRVAEWLALDKPPHPDLAVASGSYGLRADAGSCCIRNRLANPGSRDAVDDHHDASVAVRTFPQRLPGQCLKSIAVVGGRIGCRFGRCHPEQSAARTQHPGQPGRLRGADAGRRGMAPTGRPSGGARKY
jgi:hypothetical protein